MIIVIRPDSREEDIRQVLQSLEAQDLKGHVSQGDERTIIGVIGDKSKLNIEGMSRMRAVEKMVPVTESYKLANRQFKPAGSHFSVGDVIFGEGHFVMMAGPCAVESEEQVEATAKAVSAAGATVLRGGAYKPRTSPYSFQGLALEGLKILRAAADRHDMLVISEVMSETDLDAMADYVDILQIGARNAQNFRLLSAAGRSGKPVLIKRGMSQTIDEFLGSAEYVMKEGNDRVILCERGMRTFETATRFTLDISAVPVLHEKSHLPVIVDPSHAAGKASLIPALSLSAVAAGADGLVIEVHPDPPSALSDAAQQLTPDAYAALADKIYHLRETCHDYPTLEET